MPSSKLDQLIDALAEHLGTTSHFVHKRLLIDTTDEIKPTIYDLKVHESSLIQVKVIPIDGYPKHPKHCPLYPYVWQVTRVATGWIYQDANPNIPVTSTVFVPLTNYQSTSV